MIYLYTIFYFLILYANHQNFPGLHGDEAYFGIVAKKILNQPFYSIPVNGMNDFTSGFHSKLVSWFSFITKNPISMLRLPSITLNTLMFFLVLKSFKKNIHLSALIFFLTSFLFIHLKLGFEVVSITPICFSVFLLLFKNQNYSLQQQGITTYLIFLLMLIGFANHPIFAVASGALFIFFILKNDLKNLVTSSALNICLLSFLILKRHQSFLSNGNYVVFLFTYAFLFFQLAMFLRRFDLKLSASRFFQKLKKYLTFSLLIYFTLAHLSPFIETILGTNILRRYFGVELGFLPSLAISIIFGILILFFIFKNRLKLKGNNLFIFLISIFMMMTIVTNRPVIRHYIIPVIALVFFLLDYVTIISKKKVYAALIPVCSIHIFLILKPNVWQNSKNLLYRIYRKHDTSAHYSQVAPLLKYLQSQNISPKELISNEFIKRPLNYLGLKKTPSGPTLYIDHCYSEKCTVAGFNIYLEKPEPFNAFLDHKTRYRQQK